VQCFHRLSYLTSPAQSGLFPSLSSPSENFYIEGSALAEFFFHSLKASNFFSLRNLHIFHWLDFETKEDGDSLARFSFLSSLCRRTVTSLPSASLGQAGRQCPGLLLKEGELASSFHDEFSRLGNAYISLSSGYQSSGAFRLSSTPRTRRPPIIISSLCLDLNGNQSRD